MITMQLASSMWWLCEFPLHAANSTIAWLLSNHVRQLPCLTDLRNESLLLFMFNLMYRVSGFCLVLTSLFMLYVICWYVKSHVLLCVSLFTRTVGFEWWCATMVCSSILCPLVPICSVHWDILCFSSCMLVIYEWFDVNVRIMQIMSTIHNCLFKISNDNGKDTDGDKRLIWQLLQLFILSRFIK